jgi:hypothetical protein
MALVNIPNASSNLKAVKKNPVQFLLLWDSFLVSLDESFRGKRRHSF